MHWNVTLMWASFKLCQRSSMRLLCLRGFSSSPAAFMAPSSGYGMSWWHCAEGNYWGHNAIIRVSAFAGAAGLPTLRGPPPFGGPIMSHDFVEAALMRRMGWAVHVAPGLTGSYEDSAIARRLHGAGPALVSGQSSAYRRAGGPRLTLGQPTASSNRYRLLRHGANVARLSPSRSADLAASAFHPARIFRAGIFAFSAVAD